MNATELDVRELPKPKKHPTIFATYEALTVGESFILVNNHDPIPLHKEFDADYPGSYDWTYLDKGPREWRIQITKRASTPLPRILADTHALSQTDAKNGGAIWNLEPQQRDLDSNLIWLPAGDSIQTHAGPDLDVLVHVVGGSGILNTEAGEVELTAGKLAWLPRQSQRGFTAGPEGLAYLTVHQRRQSLPMSIDMP
ncbi:MAG TPA: DUF2249 domain-containing protein [Candidatus Stackebrandtia faecavium]|nr:DUF2249 domain-containing protein [Candidatus Stackebrandtia faecavium]